MIPHKTAALSALLLIGMLGASCDNPASSGPSGKSVPEKKFYAYNWGSQKYDVIKARKLAEGSYCTVWVENGSGVDEAGAQIVAAEYDLVIYPEMKQFFGYEINVPSAGQMNILDYGDYLSDQDGKLLILLMDLKDGSTTNAYLAGMFNPGDFTTNGSSNQADMLYIDVKQGKLGTEVFYATIAHELQHLIHFASNIGLGRSERDLWIDEGLSSAAEYVYLKVKNGSSAVAHTRSGRVLDYNGDPLIPQGNTFFVWDGYIADYATAYLFFQWLRIQSNGTDIYMDILKDANTGYRAVTDAAANRIDASYVSWEALLRDWFAATGIHAATGRYGYEGELYPIPRTTSHHGTITLRPGEGVYSQLTSAKNVTPAGNITYAGLTPAGVDQPGAGTHPNGRALLTFNKNTNNAGGGETGQIAASIAGAEPEPVTAARSAAPQRPYPIGVSDLLGGRPWEPVSPEAFRDFVPFTPVDHGNRK